MRYRVLPGGVPGVLTGTYPGGFRYPFGIVPGVTCGKRLFRAKGRCGSGAGGYGDMGREEIRRLCLNVWASPAVSPGGRAGCMPDLRSPPGPLPIWSHPPGCMSRAAAPFPFRGGNIEGRPAGGGPGFFRDGRHTSGHGSESGRAARVVRGRCGRLRATYTRSRDALPGSMGNGFVSGALLPLVASRAVCVGRIYSGLWRNYG